MWKRFAKGSLKVLSRSLGGPILRDRLWFYGSVNLPSITTTDRVNNLGTFPDEERETEEFFGKLTANPLSRHFLNLSARSRDVTTSNSIGASTFANASPTIATEDSTDYLLGTFSWIWTNRFSLEKRRIEDWPSGTPM